MRAISLVNRLEFDFGGNVVRNGVKLGDVDNDGNNELIVGNEAGELVIFKVKFTRGLFFFFFLKKKNFVVGTIKMAVF